MGQAGWHRTGKLVVPDVLAAIAIPAKCPASDPVESIWQLTRDNGFSSPVFASYDDIVDPCSQAENALIDQPWDLMTIGRGKGSW